MTPDPLRPCLLRVPGTVALLAFAFGGIQRACRCASTDAGPAERDPLRLPVRFPRQLRRRVVSSNNRLVRGHFHERFGGTITHFRAALDHQGRNLMPDQWSAYVGDIEVIDVPSLHAHLT
ncbi:MAG: amino acid adenylation domain protein [Xanthobacteraceae bacterium]|jgi:hypothetical protein|nr:amino acid adenylation domain protein [Xanthobacteraceae bacterium]